MKFSLDVCLMMILKCSTCFYFEEELGSDEESGKDWSELEEEATKGRNLLHDNIFLSELGTQA